MKKIILIAVGIIIVAVLGRLGWAYYQVKSDEAKVTNAPALVATTTPEPTQTTTVTSNQIQSVVVPTTKETEIQKDINTIQAEISSCKNKYGNLAFCSSNDALIGLINNCLKYVGDVNKAKECAITQYMTLSGLPSVSMDSETNTTKINGVIQLSSLLVVGETSSGFTLACVDKNTPKTTSGVFIGVTDTTKARKLIATNENIDQECSGSISLGVMCDKVDVSPYVKCSQAVTKYGPYKTSKEVDIIVEKYGKMLGLAQ